MRVPLLVAARQPSNLLILLLALGAGGFVALWLLPVGLALYVVLVGLTQRDVALLTRMNQPKPVKAPRKTVFQPQIDAVVRAQQAITEAVEGADPVLRRALVRVTDQVDGIVAQSFDLASKGQLLVNHLASINRDAINTQLIRTEAQQRTATDAVLRQQYAETQQSLQEQLDNYDNLTTYRDRIAAQLDNICANLNNVLSQTVLLRTAGTMPGGATTEDVSNRLGDLRADMDAFGQVLDTALTGVA